MMGQPSKSRKVKGYLKARERYMMLSWKKQLACTEMLRRYGELTGSQIGEVNRLMEEKK